MSRLRPFFKYYGAKFRMAPKYPAPQHQDLIETHAGSAQYATLHSTHDVTLIELDAEIAELWRWLIGVKPAAIRALPFDLPHGMDLRDLDVPNGGRLLIRSWQRVGRSDCWTVSKWNGANSGFWSESTRDDIARQVEAIRHWRVMRADAMAVTPFGHSKATWFVDTPYQSQPDVYGKKGSGPDFGKLGAWCQKLPGQVIVCEAPGADWLPFRELAPNTVGRTRQGGTRAKRMEMIWTNNS